MVRDVDALEALRARAGVVRGPAGFLRDPVAGGQGGGGAEGVGDGHLVGAGIRQAGGSERQIKLTGIVIAAGDGGAVFGPGDGRGRRAGKGHGEVGGRAGLGDGAEGPGDVAEEGGGFDDRKDDGGSRDGGAEGIGGSDRVSAGIGGLEIEKRKRVGRGAKARERVVGDDDVVAFPLVGDRLGRGDGDAENGVGATRGDGAAEGQGEQRGRRGGFEEHQAADDPIDEVLTGRAADKEGAIGEGRDDVNRGTGRAGGERSAETEIERAGGGEADETAATLAVEGGEIAGENDAAVGLQRERLNRGGGAGAGGEGGVEGAGGGEAGEAGSGGAVVEAEEAAGDHAVIGLKREGGDGERGGLRGAEREAGADDKGGVAAPGGEETGDPGAGHAVERGEAAAGGKATVGVGDEGIDRAVEAGAVGGGERGIGRAGGQEAGDAIGGDGVERREGTASGDATVGEEREGVHLAAKAGTEGRGESGIEHAVGGEAGDAIYAGRGAGIGGEITADDEATVALLNDGADDAVGTGARRERGVERTGRIEPHEVGRGRAADVGEEAADDEFAVGDGLHGEDLAGLEELAVERIERAVGVEADEAGAGGGIDEGARAADEDLVGGALDRDVAHGAVEARGAERGVERGVDGAVGGGDAHKAVDRGAVVAGERSTDDKVAGGADGLERHGERADRAAETAEADASRKPGLAGAEGIEADDAVGGDAVVGDETADDDELVVGGLEREGGGGELEAGAGHEGGIEGAEFGEAGDAGRGVAVEGGEVADGDDFLVGLEDEGVDGVVEAGAEGERGVGRAVGEEADDAVGGVAVDAGEGAGEEDLLIGGLDREGVDRAAGDAGTDFDGEGGVEGAVLVEAGEAELVGAADVAEAARDDDLVVRLEGEMIDGAGDERGIPGRVARAVGEEAYDALGDRAIELGEGTGGVEATVGVGGEPQDAADEFDAGLEGRTGTQAARVGGGRNGNLSTGGGADGEAVVDGDIVVAGGVEAEVDEGERGGGRAGDRHAEFAPLIAEGAGAGGGDGERGAAADGAGRGERLRGDGGERGAAGEGDGGAGDGAVEIGEGDGVVRGVGEAEGGELQRGGGGAGDIAARGEGHAVFQPLVLQVFAGRGDGEGGGAAAGAGLGDRLRGDRRHGRGFEDVDGAAADELGEVEARGADQHVTVGHIAEHADRGIRREDGGDADRGVGGAGAGDARKREAVGAVDGAKEAAEENLVVGLERDGVDLAVRAGRGGEAGVEGAVGIEDGDAVAGDGVVGREGTAGDDLVVEAGREGEHLGVGVETGAARGGERGVGRAGRREAGDVIGRDRGVQRGERAADHDAAIGLEREAVDGAVEAGADGGVERGIGGAVGLDAGDAIEGAAAEGREGAADHDLAVGLKHRGVDLSVEARAVAGAETEVEGAVGEEPGQVRARRGVVIVEIAADHEATVGQGRDGGDGAVEAGPNGVEGGVKGAVGVESSEVVARRVVDELEEAADIPFAVGRGLDGQNLAGPADCGGGCGVERTGGVDGDAREAVAGGAIPRRERTAEEQAGVGRRDGVLAEEEGVDVAVGPCEGVVEGGVAHPEGGEAEDPVDVGGGAVEGGEIAAGVDVARGVDREGVHVAAKPGSDSEGGLVDASRIKAGEAIAVGGNVVDRGEAPADVEFGAGASAGEREGESAVVQAGAHVEGGIVGAVDREAEQAVAIGGDAVVRREETAGVDRGGGAGAIDHESADVTAEAGGAGGRKHEGGVDRAGRIHANQAVDRGAVVRGEGAAGEVANGAIGHDLAGERVERAVGRGPGGKRRNQGTVGLAEFGEAPAGRAADAGEVAADDNAVGLDQDGADGTAGGDRRGNPGVVVRAVGVEAGDAEARVAVDAGEFARDVDAVAVGGIDGDGGGVGVVDFDARRRGTRAQDGRIVGDGGDDIDADALRGDGGEAIADDDVVVAGVGERGRVKGQRGGDGPGERDADLAPLVGERAGAGGGGGDRERGPLPDRHGGGDGRRGDGGRGADDVGGGAIDDGRAGAADADPISGGGVGGVRGVGRARNKGGGVAAGAAIPLEGGTGEAVGGDGEGRGAAGGEGGGSGGLGEDTLEAGVGEGAGDDAVIARDEERTVAVGYSGLAE